MDRAPVSFWACLAGLKKNLFCRIRLFSGTWQGCAHCSVLTLTDLVGYALDKNSLLSNSFAGQNSCELTTGFVS
jgi:hypothetical protein